MEPGMPLILIDKRTMVIAAGVKTLIRSMVMVNRNSISHLLETHKVSHILALIRTYQLTLATKKLPM